MAGSKEGARKRRENMIAKLGSEEAYLEFQRKIGTKGGKTGGRGGFAMMTPEEVREHGKRGGHATAEKRKRERD